MVVILNHALVALYLYYRDRTRFSNAGKPASEAPHIGSDSGGLDWQMGNADGVQVSTACVFPSNMFTLYRYARHLFTKHAGDLI